MEFKKEYYLVNEISKIKKMTARNVRAIIDKLDKEKNDFMIRKSNDGVWEVHHLMLYNFDRKREKIIVIVHLQLTRYLIYHIRILI
jgi:hypothetical protein